MIELMTDWIGARFAATRGKVIRDYSEEANIRITDLVRLALDEYIVNHPLEEKK